MFRLLLLFASAWLTSALTQTVSLPESNTTAQYGFSVDYGNNTFLLDGKPFRYVSGSFHYFRSPSYYWADRLHRMRQAGLNAVSTYVEWSLHQPQPDKWVWDGDADLVAFLRAAQAADLLVILRPGPYICAERDLGGLPFWLLSRVPDIRLRTNDPRYMHYVEIYLNEVLERVKPYLRGNGGPIIMVQVENEYGSYNACDGAYTDKLRDIMKAKIGDKALLYTTDGASAGMLRCGVVPGAYATVDFGTSADVIRSFGYMRLYQPRGPLVNSEFYPGWLTHWDEPFQRVQTSAVVKTLDQMLAMGANVNIYMFYGGTNFGYTAGANGGEGSYAPDVTSYDYDAPLSEAGYRTEKYYAIKNVIAKYLPIPDEDHPGPFVTGYGPILMSKVVDLFEPLGQQLFKTVSHQSKDPLTFEALGLPNYLVLYEANIPTNVTDPPVLVANVRDRALVYLDDYLVGILSRSKKIYSLPLPSYYGQKIKLLVENQGRLNFGNEFHDFKGLSNVTISDINVGPWTMSGFLLNDVTPLQNITTTTTATGVLRNGPVFLRGTFDTSLDFAPSDTFLDTTGWGKGVAFINGHNLGRYWPTTGPQMTLYVPGIYLDRGRNELVILEMEYVPSSMKMTFRGTPILDAHVQQSDTIDSV